MRPLRRLVALATVALCLIPAARAAAQGSTVDVSPITARLDEETTTTEYTIQVLAPAGAEIQVNWNKPSCGTWERPAPTLFRWTHPHPPCTDPLLHPGEVITVLVTVRDLDVRFTCTYRGADSGTGEPCTSRSLGLTPTPTVPASPTAPPTSVPSPTAVVPAEEPSGVPLLAVAAAGAVLAIALVGFLVVAIRRRRERALDPCAPRQRRGMGYLAEEIARYAEENRAAVLLAIGHGSLTGAAPADTGAALGDLWVDAGRAGRAAWSSVLGTEDGLVRSTRNPELAGRARGWLGDEGPWRAASEAIATRIARRSGTGYQQARTPGWSGAAGSIIGRLAGSMDAPSAAAIAANAFASAAIAAADALARLNDASDAAGCPTVPMPEVVFATVPAGADPSAPGDRLLLHRLGGGEPVMRPIADATADDLEP